jgi:hypothetical protein
VSGLDHSLFKTNYAGRKVVKKGLVLVLAVAAAAIGISTLLLSGALGSSPEADKSGEKTPLHVSPDTSSSHLPLDVKSVFNDREKALDALGSTYFYIDESFVDSDNHCDFCIGVAYTLGPNERATLAFRGNAPLDLSSAKILTFDVRGDADGEKVRIHALGKKIEDQDATLPDGSGLRGVTFAFSRELILSNRWQSYDIDLQEFDRSGITHAFAFEVLKGSTSDEKQFVYFDTILLQAEPTDYATRLN